MPTYGYICDNCGYEFDEFQSIKADALKKCPKCGKETLRRLIGGGGGIIFKGSGFYQTDYKNKPTQTATKKTEVKKEKTASGNETPKTDTPVKPAESTKTSPAKKD